MFSGGNIAAKIFFAIACFTWFNLFLNRNKFNKSLYVVLMIIIPVVLFILLKYYIL